MLAVPMEHLDWSVLVDLPYRSILMTWLQITCVKASQGFDWNQGMSYYRVIVEATTNKELDIFLPSYLDHDSSDLEHRPDPVQEIVLTDEEAAAILPK